MSTRSILVLTVLLLLFVLHQDFWLWDDATLWLGLPAGLTYHIVYCLVVSAAMAAIVRLAWPPGLGDDDVDH